MGEVRETLAWPMFYPVGFVEEREKLRGKPQITACPCPLSPAQRHRHNQTSLRGLTHRETPALTKISAAT